MGRRTHHGIVAVVCLLAGVAVAAEKTGKTEKPRLAVVDFKVLGDVGIKDAGQSVAELLLARFDTEKYQLVERAHLVKILEEHKLTMADIVSNPALVKRKKLKGVRYLVVGSVVKFGKLRIAARVVDVTTGYIGKKAEVSASDADGLADRLGQLSAILSGKKLGPPPKTLTLALGRGAAMKLALIHAGKFLMGSPQTARDAHIGEKPQREVTITKSFYMGVTEVTQNQWHAVIGTEPWKSGKHAKKGAENPVSYVSWDDATAFCTKVSQKTGRTIRLPTEAEWEYACRAGTKTVYSFDDDSKLGEYAWTYRNAKKVGEEYPHPVARKKPNAWGLYDMHGNVWEWCGDWYDKKYYSAAGNTVDPAGPVSGPRRVLRGGSYYSMSYEARSASRCWSGGEYRDNSYGGFRVVLPVVASTATK